MFSLFFQWIRHKVAEAVYAGLQDAAEQLDDGSQANAQAVTALKSRVLALTAGDERPVSKKSKS